MACLKSDMEGVEGLAEVSGAGVETEGDGMRKMFPDGLESCAEYGAEETGVGELSSQKAERSSPNRSSEVDEACTGDIKDTKDHCPDTTTESESKDDSEDARHRCDMCGKSFQYVKGLRVHFETQHNPKRYTCETCKKSYGRKDVLLRHCQQVHLKIIPQRSPRCLTKTVVCKFCGKAFWDISSLNRHKVIHSEVRPYKCDVCGRAFILKGDLKKHFSTHTNERPHKCDICGKAFARNSTLKKHLVTHTDGKAHKCEICDRGFCRRDVLIEHLRIHSGELPYGCEKCGARFHQRSTLFGHIKTGKCIRFDS